MPSICIVKGDKGRGGKLVGVGDGGNEPYCKIRECDLGQIE